MRDEAGRGIPVGVALVAALALSVSGCAALQRQGQTNGSPSPATSPSPQASPQALAIISATFHTGEVNVQYAPVTLNATGGVTPYTWTVASGALPGGLTISANGTVSGKPTKAGTFHVTLQVGDAAGGAAKAVRTVGIAKALKATLIPACAVQCLVEVGCVSVCGKFGTLSGGVPPYTYTSLGNIPTGVHLSGLSLAGTFVSGPRFSQFTVNVTDAFGASTSISPMFNVFPHITFTGGTCQGSGSSCSIGLSFTVGVSETPTVKVVAWVGKKTCGSIAPVICPAPPFSAVVQGSQVMVTLGPASSPNTTGTFKLSLTDQFPCAAGAYCSATATLTVNLA